MARVLLTGRGTSGSWLIRGAQLAEAMGATAQPLAADASAYDVIVLVKRGRPDLLQRIRSARRPLIWDVVDAWPQPAGNAWGREDCLAWLRSMAREIRPDGIVAATQAMAADCLGLGVPVLALPHHARPGLTRAPIRPDLRLVAYEGSAAHLGRWAPWFAAQCAHRGVTFALNPPQLTDADAVVAMRGAGGYAERAWKSNVKLANAQAAGLPMICAREAGYVETGSGAECWAETEAHAADWLDLLRPEADRRRIGDRMAAAAPRIAEVAATYAAWLAQYA